VLFLQSDSLSIYVMLREAMSRPNMHDKSVCYTSRQNMPCEDVWVYQQCWIVYYGLDEPE